MKIHALLLSLSFVAAPTFAAERLSSFGTPAGPPTPMGVRAVSAYGAALSVHTVHGFTFGVTHYSNQKSYDASGSIYSAGGDPYFEIPITLPSGMLLVGLEVEGCDNSPSNEMRSFLYDCTLGGSCTAHNGPASGLAAAEGCGFWQLQLPPITLDQLNHSYGIEVFSAVPGNTVKFRAVRLYYVRQVSPAPAVATFADVPTTHPFFKFVEALFAAGITGGCGGGNYCPTNPVTRGQMAVFLATALGLHWPDEF